MLADYNDTGKTRRKLKNDTLGFFIKRHYWMQKHQPKEREDGLSQDTLFSVINTNIFTSPSTCKLLQSTCKAYVVLGEQEC